MKIFSFTLILLASFSSIKAQTINEHFSSKNSAKELWRVLADCGKYQDAIDILLDSIHIKKQKNKHAIYWHIGQLFAFNNDYNSAIKYINKSTNFFHKLIDREWRLYLNGTIAFLKKDKSTLKICNEKLRKKHSVYYYYNACKLKALYDNFELPYKLAYEMNCK